jgi:hypothetical protein
MHRYDIFGFGLALFAIVILIAICLDPKGFSIQAWQPLMASIIALGGATIVYRGARLAYSAAMAKVDLDRVEAERRRSSERLGLLLRLRVSLARVLQDAKKSIHLIETNFPNNNYTQRVDLTQDHIMVYDPPELVEIWNRIELFPIRLIEDLETLRRLLPQLTIERTNDPNASWPIDFPHGQFGQYFNRRPADYLVNHARRCRFIEASCNVIITDLDKVITMLRSNEEH